MPAPTNSTYPQGRNFVAIDYLGPLDATDIAIVSDADYDGGGTGTHYATLDGVNFALKIDKINEFTAAAGVTIDSVLVKDGGVRAANNVAFKHRNAADSADIDTIKLNASDKIVFGANVASLVLDAALLPASGGTGNSGTPTDGQLLIGHTANGTYSKASLTGTANRVTVTGGAGTITLSGPQDLHSAATPSFAGIDDCAYVVNGGGMTIGPTNANDLEFQYNGTTIVQVTAGQTFEPPSAAGANLGSETNYFNGLNIQRIAFRGSQGNSSKNPAVDAVADWAQVLLGATTYYIPLYAA